MLFYTVIEAFSDDQKISAANRYRVVHSTDRRISDQVTFDNMVAKTPEEFSQALTKFEKWHHGVTLCEGDKVILCLWIHGGTPGNVRFGTKEDPQYLPYHDFFKPIFRKLRKEVVLFQSICAGGKPLIIGGFLSPVHRKRFSAHDA